MPTTFRSMIVGSLFVAAAAPAAVAQQSDTPAERRVSVAVTAGYARYGAYFEAPGDIVFSNENGPHLGAEVAIRLSGPVAVVAGASYARSEWVFENVPALGDVSVGDARLWFLDAAVRYHFLLDPGGTVVPFAQVGPGFIRYAIQNPSFDQREWNYALVGGLGADLRLGGPLTLRVLAKDYWVSFRSVDEGAEFGIVGRRTHTIVGSLGLALAF